ncbi:MAG: YhcN/YlaJ family sporulation lipoprotein [Clostridia bacterium]|nr:YhcN/YlaJ family sporulation lipoprotein [Clostridia bacterium]
MVNKKKIIYVFLLIFLISAFMTGCMNARRPAPDTTPRTPDTTERTRYYYDDTTPRRPDTNYYDRDITDDRINDRVDDDNVYDANTKAKRIASQITKLKDVEKASVVLSGNTCIVGVELDSKLRDRMTETVKERIETKCKNADPAIKRVVVSADPDIFDRLKSMASDIEKGKPLSGFTEEIDEIIDRIKPQTR